MPVCRTFVCTKAASLRVHLGAAVPMMTWCRDSGHYEFVIQCSELCL